MSLLKRNKKSIYSSDFHQSEIADIFLLRCFSYEWRVSTLDVKVQLAPPSVKSKMEALTPKSSIKHMVTALNITVNFNDR